MARVKARKDDRLQVRLNTRSKRVLERAAGYRHKSISRFVLDTAMAAAQRVISEHNAVTLSERDWTIFYKALCRPPAPNTALREAARRYRRTHG